MDRAGLETMLMNYYRNMDQSEIQFDFLTHRDEVGAYEEEINNMGGRVYHAPRLYPQNHVKYFKYMKDFFENHPEYLVIHSHIDSMSYYPLLAAKNSGIPVRIGHSHNSKLDKDLKLPIKFFALKKMPKVANVHFSCGEMAGKFMYPNEDFTVIHNAIDLNRFSYDDFIREKVRTKLNIDNSLVIGHVGRFCRVKNQLFLLEVFKEILRLNSNSLLMLVGKGEDESKIRKKVLELGIEDKVKVLIDRSDVNELYQAFDVFVMPSLFEGLPVVGVEAQANGLPCIFSDDISKEIILTDNAERLSLNCSAEEWSKRIIEKNTGRNNNATKELQEKGYDIKIEAKKLQKWYLNIYEKAKGMECI
jgi:glycosyltransferase involved in cell wall biosynthesis